MTHHAPEQIVLEVLHDPEKYSSRDIRSLLDDFARRPPKLALDGGSDLREFLGKYREYAVWLPNTRILLQQGKWTTGQRKYFSGGRDQKIGAEDEVSVTHRLKEVIQDHYRLLRQECNSHISPAANVAELREHLHRYLETIPETQKTKLVKKNSKFWGKVRICRYLEETGTWRSSEQLRQEILGARFEKLFSHHVGEHALRQFVNECLHRWGKDDDAEFVDNVEEWDRSKMINFLIQLRTEFEQQEARESLEGHFQRKKKAGHDEHVVVLQATPGSTVFDLGPIEAKTTEVVFHGNVQIDPVQFNTAVRQCKRLKRIVFSYFDQDIDLLVLPESLQELDLGQMFGRLPAWGYGTFFTPNNDCMYKSLPVLPKSLQTLLMPQETNVCVQFQNTHQGKRRSEESQFFVPGSQLRTFCVGQGVTFDGLSYKWFSNCKRLEVLVTQKAESITYAQSRGWLPEECSVKVLPS